MNGLTGTRSRTSRSRVGSGVILLLSLVLLCPAYVEGSSQADSRGEGSPEVEAWARVLSSYHRPGGLDYAGLESDQDDLELYLAGLAGAEPADWAETDQKAFWSNAYNAVMVHYVLEHYPGIQSVREIDGIFGELQFTVAGEALTLDEIETRARDLGDPRVHFAVVCASTSCPDLRGEPYRGEEIDRQLDDAMRGFLASPTKGLRYDEEANTLWLSSIFKWYAGDFTGGSTVAAFFARGKVLGWLLPNLPPDLAEKIRQREPKIRYLDYDWTLNDRSEP
ncbi:MAG: DUF547 domain-containing protein [Thermoanaerobaculia bacterium]